MTPTHVAFAASDAAGSTSIEVPFDIMAPVVQASASVAEIGLGRPFVVIVTASFRPDMKVNLVDPVPLGQAFEVQRRWSTDRTRTDGNIERQWQLEVLPWELGEQVVPSIVVTYVAGGKAGQVMTSTLAIKVLGTLAEADIATDDTLRPLLPPKEFTARSWRWLWVTGAGLGAVLLSTMGLLWWRGRKRSRVGMTGGAVKWGELDDAAKRALRSLAAMEQSGVITSAPLQGFERLAIIVRNFGSERYGFVGTDLTTNEWLMRLAQRAPAANRQMFARWFAPVDMVKYASTQAQADDAKNALQQARELVVASILPSAVEPESLLETGRERGQSWSEPADAGERAQSWSEPADAGERAQ